MEREEEDERGSVDRFRGMVEKKWRGEHTALADAARACRCFFAIGIVIGLYFGETKTAHYTNEKEVN